MTLPIEVLYMIFMIVIEQSPPVLGSSDERDLGWKALLSVCKSWRTFILDCKRIWAAVHVHDPSSLPDSIARAGDGLLEYSLTLFAPRSWNIMDKRVESMACLHFDARRYRSIHIDRHDAAFHHLHKMLSLTEPLDNLEELYLGCWGLDPTLRLLLHIIQHSGRRDLRAPNLRSVTMQNICITIQSNVMRFLDINYASVEYDTRPALGVICDVLRNVRHVLEELRLDHAVGNYVLEAEPVTFEALQSIVVIGASVDALVIFDRLRLPAFTTRKLEVVTRYGQVGGLGRALRLASGTAWNHLRLRSTHIWEDNVVLSVEASESGCDAASESYILRTEVVGRQRTIPSWHRIAWRVLSALKRDGLDVALEVSELSLVRDYGGIIRLQDMVWESLGGRGLDGLNMTVQSACTQCGAARGLDSLPCSSERLPNSHYLQMKLTSACAVEFEGTRDVRDERDITAEKMLHYAAATDIPVQGSSKNPDYWLSPLAMTQSVWRLSDLLYHKWCERAPAQRNQSKHNCSCRTQSPECMNTDSSVERLQMSLFVQDDNLSISYLPWWTSFAGGYRNGQADLIIGFLAGSSTVGGYSNKLSGLSEPTSPSRSANLSIVDLEYRAIHDMMHRHRVAKGQGQAVVLAIDITGIEPKGATALRGVDGRRNAGSSDVNGERVNLRLFQAPISDTILAILMVRLQRGEVSHTYAADPMSDSPQHYVNLHLSLADGVETLDSLEGSVVSSAGRSLVNESMIESLRHAISGLDELRLSASRALNSVNVLLRLPLEILTYICRELVRISKPRLRSPSSYRYGWMVILWVCHDLRQLALADAYVWALAYSHFPARMKDVLVNALLSHSQPWTYHTRANNGTVDCMRLRPLIETVSWRSCVAIYLENRGEVPRFVKKLFDLSKEKPLLALKDLSVWMSSRHRDYSDESEHYFADDKNWLDVPVLETAYFDGAWFPLRSTVLRSLSYVWEKGSLYSAPQVHSLFKMLEPHAFTLRDLRILDAIDAIDLSRFDVDRPPLPSLRMPRLSRLELGGTPARLLPLLKSLPVDVVPNLLLRVKLTSDYYCPWIESERGSVDYIQRVGSLIRDRRIEYRTIRLECSRDAFSRHCFLLRAWKATSVSENDLLFDADLTVEFICRAQGSPGWNAVFLAIAPSIPLMKVETVIFQLACRGTDHYDIEDEFWTRIFAALPALVRLEVNGELAGKDFVSWFLNRASSSGSTD
ncbi:hypothetical protein PENSPDRAFT_670069 [Peniophora sp. CONT]|nr:hypothetical protein PENSPDRAFT_670069 [Peniophora sp. CONT]